jgi:hypothetical protein
MPALECIANFKEVKQCFEEDTAMKEAKRCLSCFLRFQIPPPNLPPERWIPFDEKNIIDDIPNIEGVYQISDREKNVLKIAGVENLRKSLLEELRGNRNKISYFNFEIDPMYTARERQLLQQHVKKHGKMPGGEELDELF